MCTGTYDHDYTYQTQFAKNWHNNAFLAIRIFASVSSIYLKLCSVIITLLYCKYFSRYKARQQVRQYISFVDIPTTINITSV